MYLLATICEIHLCKNISHINVIGLFLFADRHCLAHLKEATIDYIKQHAQDIATNSDLLLLCSEERSIIEAIVRPHTSFPNANIDKLLFASRKHYASSDDNLSGDITIYNKDSDTIPSPLAQRFGSQNFCNIM
jgi:hypothetical protein